MKKKPSAKSRPPKARTKQSVEVGNGRLLPPEFLQGRPDARENLLALERLLTRAEGFTLAFARVNMPAQRAELVQEIRRRLEPQGFIIIEVDLTAPVHDLLEALGSRLKSFYALKSEPEQRTLAVAEAGPRFAVFVYGLEHAISSSAIYHPLLAVMNYKRENFRAQIAGPLVLWVPEYVLQAIMEGAPDFWAWRSGVFEFAAPQQEVEKTWLTVKPEAGQVKLDRLTTEEKRHRIQMLSSLLAEYESRADADVHDVVVVRTDLLNRLGRLHYFLGDLRKALEYLEKSLAIRREIGDRAGEGMTLNNISQVFKARGDYGKALSYLEKSLAIRREIGDRLGESATLNNISQVFKARGDYGKALAYLEKSLVIQREIGDRAGEGTTLNNLSQIYSARGDYGKALAYLEKSLVIQREIGNRAGEGTTLNNLGQIYSARGDYGKALTYLEKSLATQIEIGDRLGEGRTLSSLSHVFKTRGDYRKALAYLEKSLAIQIEIGDRPGEGTTLNNVSLIYSARGDYSNALTYLEKSLAITREIGDRPGMIPTLHNIAHIYLQNQQLQEARQTFTEALQLARETNNTEGLFNVSRDLGNLLCQMGQKEQGLHLLQQALEVGQQLGHPNVAEVEALLQKYS